MKYFAYLVLFLGLPLLALAQGTDFVPLTNIPAISEVGNAINTPDGLALFLNNIYKLCIGVAAVVAVLQIMRAGIIYMGGDSVTEKKEAKNLIALAIGGLILVLSPVIVFSIINPEILSLKIGGIDKLRTATSSPMVLVLTASEAECREKGGTPTGGEPPRIICEVEPGSEADEAERSCTNFRDFTIISNQTTCSPYLGESYVAVGEQCCSGMQSGNRCCALPKSVQDFQSPTTTTPTVSRWGWRARVVPVGGGSEVTAQRAPFNSKAACEASVTEYASANRVEYTGEFQCTCNSPLSEQPTCSTL